MFIFNKYKYTLFDLITGNVPFAEVPIITKNCTIILLLQHPVI